MPTKTLPATEVKDRFGRVLREIAQTGGPIIVERDGNPVAVILGIGEYACLQPRAAVPTEQPELLNASFGLWAGRSDIDEARLLDGRSRWESKWVNE